LHEATGREGGHEVRAFLAAPEAASTTARSTFLFVARRFVRDRSLLHALALGYGELLEKGRYPLAALFLEIPGGDLDVNVHPQKLEVRFARAAEVYAAVRHVVAGAVARAPWLPAPRGAIRVHTLPPLADRRADGGGGPRQPDRISQLALSDATALPSGPARIAFRPPFGDGQAPSQADGEDAYQLGRNGGSSPFSPSTSSWSSPPSSWPALSAESPSHLADGPAAPAEAAQSGSAYFGALSYIGQLDRTYLVCEAAGELVLVDQHAAHERVAYERLRAAHARREIRQQRLLFPIPVELEEAQVAAAAEPSVMERLGFDVRRGGDRSLVVSAVPEVLKDADVKPLLVDVLARLADGDAAAERSGGAAAERIDHILATMACHSVVRAGDVLSRTQAVALLVDLDAVDLRTHCPHGRPVLLRLPLAEIERRFGRA